MRLHKVYQFILIFIVSISGISQELDIPRIYLDENMNTMDITLYLKKCKSHAFKCLEYKSDSLIIHKILYKHSFGKITNTENTQLRSLLSRDSGENIDPNAIIIIKFYDSILNFESLKRNYDRHAELHKTKAKTKSKAKIEVTKKVEDSSIAIVNTNKFKHPPYNLKKYNTNEKTWVRSRNKCIKKFEKINNVTVLHTFKDSQRNKENQPKFKLVKDRSVLKNTFFKIIYNYRFAVLKPNGEYFLSGGHLGDKKLKKLLNDKNWTTIKNDWNTTIEKYPINGYGFFGKLNNHETHCF